MPKYLAFDLGAESGRAIIGELQNDKIQLTEITRFLNITQQINGHLHWKIDDLFNSMLDGLKKAAEQHPDLSSLGCDTWGVDYALLDNKDKRLEEPYCYRDVRTDGFLEKAFERVPKKKIYDETGIQFMSINTLYQFFATTLSSDKAWKDVGTILWIADYFHFLFSGKKVAEVSLASTSQAYNPKTKTWSKPLLEKFGIPEKALPPIVSSGTKLGTLLPAIAKKCGTSEKIQVVAPCSHDTGAAVAAVPAQGDKWAYLSCGTWSLLGIELNKPLITDTACELGFTHEIGVNDTIRFLKNIVGLWIVQECRRYWESKGNAMDYPTLTRLANEAKPFASLINPDDTRFLKPGEMPEKISAYCQETNQKTPSTPGEFVRCALESLALQYRKTLEQLEKVLGYKIEKLHIVGGGCNNTLLCQFTADAIGRPVLSGPAEGTALGNCLIQALAMGDVKDLNHLRKIVRNSFPIQEYQPKDKQAWDREYARFGNLK